MELNYQNSFAQLSSVPMPTNNFPSKPRNKRTNTKLVNPKQARKSRKPDTFTTSKTRPCTECGKKFLSWKALFGHMRCHPERNWRGINPPESNRRSNSDSGEYSSSLTEDEHEVATCLLLLANGPTLQSSVSITTVNQVPECSSLEKNAVFECSSCKKVFGSHQALGGHRASHKNVKGCFAIKRNYEDWDEKDEEFGHRCNVCWRVFSSGQALGGHMRCHWDPLSIRVCGNGNGFDLNVPSYDGYCDSELALDLRLGL